MFNKFAAPDVEEEKARLRALVESLNAEEEDSQDEEEDTKCSHSTK